MTDEMSPTTFTVTYMGHCAVQLVILGVRIYRITNIYLCSMCSLNILICFNNFENYPLLPSITVMNILLLLDLYEDIVHAKGSNEGDFI